MNWYNYLAAFFAGMFLANAVPHFVHGVSGDRFPSPFSHPPGKGLSSPTVNVLWALLNLLVGYLYFAPERFGTAASSRSQFSSPASPRSASCSASISQKNTRVVRKVL